jgi:hypothetical protein
MILDHSSRHVWESCKRKYYWTYICNLDPGRSDAMERGRAAHQGIYTYSKTRDVEQALESVVIERPEGMLPEEEQKYRDLEYATKELVRGYVRELASKDDFTIEAVELPVAAKIPGTDDYYVGIIDALVNVPVAGRYTHEYKTSGQIPENWVARFQIDSQATGYVWLLRKIGIDVKGSIISILRTSKYPDYVRDVVDTPQWLLDELEHELRETAAQINHRMDLMAHREMDGEPYPYILFFPKTTSQCFAYNQPCPFRKLCNEPPDMRARLIADGFHKQREPREQRILERALRRTDEAQSKR